jgi:hypothetical protein
MQLLAGDGEVALLVVACPWGKVVVICLVFMPSVTNPRG